MADSSGKVAKLVHLKLEDYFNRERVEKEFDPSGKGIHTTTPRMMQLELSYLQVAEQQWRSANRKKKNQISKHSEEQEQQQEEKNKEMASCLRNTPTVEVSPRVTTNSKAKSRLRRSEIDHVTKNAQSTLSQVSVDKIHNIHRYRSHLIPEEYLDLAKAAHVSNHVYGILNTEHAWDYAEKYDDRKATKKYLEETEQGRNGSNMQDHTC